MRSARARAASRISSPSRRDLGEELLALLEQPAGGAQLLGQPLDRLVEELEHLVRLIITDDDSGIGRR